MRGMPMATPDQGNGFRGHGGVRGRRDDATGAAKTSSSKSVGADVVIVVRIVVHRSPPPLSQRCRRRFWRFGRGLSVPHWKSSGITMTTATMRGRKRRTTKTRRRSGNTGAHLSSPETGSSFGDGVDDAPCRVRIEERDSHKGGRDRSRRRQKLRPR